MSGYALFGAAGGGGGQTSSSFVPTLLQANETFVIPENKQAVFIKRIKLEEGARIKAFGILVQPR